MFDRMRIVCTPLLLAMLVILHAGSGAFAEDAAWRVSKSSGDVWVTTSGVQQASLTDDAILSPGDNIRTGRNGRVLLVRGQESILISPNSVIGIPAEKNQGRSTTIIQQAGSILLEVEKRNDRRFEVKTPFLAAVVRGTQFRVSVGKNETYVNVLRGQVEVADFRSGQYALVLPGQMAKVWVQGLAGLSLSGSGTLSPIRHGSPQTPSVIPLHVPNEGLSAPDSAPTGQQIRVARPGGDAVLFPEESAVYDNVWNSGLNYLGRLFGNADGPRNRSDFDTLIMAIPLAFGGVIAVAVAAKRRRQKQKQK